MKNKDQWEWYKIPSKLITCPNCGQLSHGDRSNCEHCDYEFTKDQIAEIREKQKKDFFRFGIFGLLFFVGFILVLSVIFGLLKS